MAKARCPLGLTIDTFAIDCLQIVHEDKFDKVLSIVKKAANAPTVDAAKSVHHETRSGISSEISRAFILETDFIAKYKCTPKAFNIMIYKHDLPILGEQA
jgi:hypothetical protein